MKKEMGRKGKGTKKKAHRDTGSIADGAVKTTRTN